MSIVTLRFPTKWMIYSGSTGIYYAINSLTGKVEITGSYATVKNSVTGSLNGSVYDSLIDSLEGYSGGTKVFYEILSGSSLSGSTLQGTNISGSQQTLSGNLYVKGTISGSNYVGISGTQGAAGNMGAHTYVIRNNGGTYEAYNGRTGAKDYSSSNFEVVWVNVLLAIDALGGGSFVLLGGTYTTANGVTINQSNVAVYGEGPATTIINHASGTNGLTIGDSSTRRYNVQVHNLGITHAGTYANASKGLYIRGLTQGVIDIIQCTGQTYGMQIDSTLFAGYNHYGKLYFLANKYGVYQDGSGYHNANSFKHISIVGTNIAASVGFTHLYGQMNVIEHMSIESFVTGMNVANSSGENLGNVYRGLYFEDMTNGIDFSSSGNKNTFSGVYMTSDVTNPIINNGSSLRNEFLGFNAGSTPVPILARNRGVTSLTSGSTVAHLCASTPRYVHCGINESTPYKLSWTWDATNITVYHDKGSAASIFWEAEI